VPRGGRFTQAENYLVDIPNGGNLTMRNNILIKNASGLNSNGASVTFDTEGLGHDGSPSPRNYSIDIENNTFVAFAATYDGAHPLWPFFFWHNLTPGTPGFEVPTLPSGFTKPPAVISHNVFVGYCPQTRSSDSYMNFRGNLAATFAFAELNADYSLKSPLFGNNVSLTKTRAYSHAVAADLVRQPVTANKNAYLAIGAEDQ
jgi:hypothetical protein